MNFAKALKIAQETSGMSTEQIARRSGLSEEIIHNILDGIHSPDVYGSNTEAKIAEAFGIPPDLLITLGIEEEDISPEKKPLFDVLGPPVQELIKHILRKRDKEE